MDLGVGVTARRECANSSQVGLERREGKVHGVMPPGNRAAGTRSCPSSGSLYCCSAASRPGVISAGSAFAQSRICFSVSLGIVLRFRTPTHATLTKSSRIHPRTLLNLLDEICSPQPRISLVAISGEHRATTDDDGFVDLLLDFHGLQRPG